MVWGWAWEMVMRVTREVLYVVEEMLLLVREIAAGSLELSESSGKISHTVSHSLSISFSINLSLWSAWKEQGSGGAEAVF